MVNYTVCSVGLHRQEPRFVFHQEYSRHWLELLSFSVSLWLPTTASFPDSTLHDLRIHILQGEPMYIPALGYRMGYEWERWDMGCRMGCKRVKIQAEV